MNKKIYRQYSSKWGSLPYPTKGSSFAGNGCGACSVLHCIIERPKYRKYTPKSIIKYMRQFAVQGQGTRWEGIYKALKHYGMQNVKWFGASDPMRDIFAELDKGGRIGVILFGSTPGPDGTIWTGDGHYIAFTGYKAKDGKHYFYLKDSGPRCHDGWYCYEKSMAGDVRQVWTCTVSKAKKPKPKEKTLKAWKRKLERCNKYYQSHGYYYNSNPRKKGGKSINCCGFPFRCLYHFGEIPKSCIYAYTKHGRLKGQGASIIKKKCIYKIIDMPIGKAIKKGLVKPGDIVGYSNGAHTEVYKGKCRKNGKLVLKFYNYGRKFRQTNGVAYRSLDYSRPVGCIIRIKGLMR